MTQKNTRIRREERRQNAIELQQARASRSTQQQLDIIANRRGESKKETARLLKQLEK